MCTLECVIQCDQIRFDQLPIRFKSIPSKSFQSNNQTIPKTQRTKPINVPADSDSDSKTGKVENMKTF